MASPFKSIIKSPEGVLALGVGSAGVVTAIYAKNLPTMADIHSAPANNTEVESSRKKAAWESGIFLGAVYLISRDWRSALIAGAVLAAIDLMVKHGNGISNLTGKLDSAAPGRPAAAATAAPGGAGPVQDLSYGYTDDGSGGY